MIILDTEMSYIITYVELSCVILISPKEILKNDFEIHEKNILYNHIQAIFIFVSIKYPKTFN